MVRRLECQDRISTKTEGEQVLFKRKPITIYPPPTNVSDNAEVGRTKYQARGRELTHFRVGLGHEGDQ